MSSKPTLTVSLTFATDTDPDVLLRSVVNATEHTAPLVATQVYRLDDLDDEPAVQLVVDAVGGIVRAYVDRPERASEHAANIRGVFVELPVVDDFRDRDGSR